MADNPNYQQQNGGWVRNPNAPDAGHKSRINWDRMKSVENAQEAVRKQREIQNQRNEEYRRTHGND